MRCLSRYAQILILFLVWFLLLATLFRNVRHSRYRGALESTPRPLVRQNPVSKYCAKLEAVLKLEAAMDGYVYQAIIADNLVPSLESHVKYLKPWSEFSNFVLVTMGVGSLSWALQTEAFAAEAYGERLALIAIYPEPNHGLAIKAVSEKAVFVPKAITGSRKNTTVVASVSKARVEQFNNSTRVVPLGYHKTVVDSIVVDAFFSSYLRRYNLVHFLTMDIEGFEKEVFPEVIRSHPVVCQILLEVHCDHWQSGPKFLDWLQDAPANSYFPVFVDPTIGRPRFRLLLLRADHEGCSRLFPIEDVMDAKRARAAWGVN